MPETAVGLIARRVETDNDVEILRELRNETAWGFAHDNGQITPEAQREWWAKVTAAGVVKAWLYELPSFGDPDGQLVVGFGTLRKTEDGKWWTSVAVREAFSGRGFGGAITADLARRQDEPCYGAARLDNVPAQRLHRTVDWEEIGRDERLVYYRTREHVHMQDALDHWGKEGWVIQ